MYSIDEEREYLSNNLQLFFERDITGGGSKDSKTNDALAVYPAGMKPASFYDTSAWRR